MPPSPNAYFTRFHPQRLVQRYGLQIIHRDLRSQRNYLAQLVYFAHGFVKDRSDNPAMAMSRRAGKSLAQAKTACEAILRLVINELQAHAIGIVSAAGKTVILLQLDVRGVVALAMRLLLHGQNSILRAASSGFTGKEN